MCFCLMKIWNFISLVDDVGWARVFMPISSKLGSEPLFWKLPPILLVFLVVVCRNNSWGLSWKLFDDDGELEGPPGLNLVRVLKPLWLGSGLLNAEADPDENEAIEAPDGCGCSFRLRVIAFLANLHILKWKKNKVKKTQHWQNNSLKFWCWEFLEKSKVTIYIRKEC